MCTALFLCQNKNANKQVNFERANRGLPQTIWKKTNNGSDPDRQFCLKKTSEKLQTHLQGCKLPVYMEY